MFDTLSIIIKPRNFVIASQAKQTKQFTRNEKNVGGIKLNMWIVDFLVSIVEHWAKATTSSITDWGND